MRSPKPYNRFFCGGGRSDTPIPAGEGTDPPAFLMAWNSGFTTLQTTVAAVLAFAPPTAPTQNAGSGASELELGSQRREDPVSGAPAGAGDATATPSNELAAQSSASAAETFLLLRLNASNAEMVGAHALAAAAISSCNPVNKLLHAVNRKP